MILPHNFYSSLIKTNETHFMPCFRGLNSSSPVMVGMYTGALVDSTRGAPGPGSVGWQASVDGGLQGLPAVQWRGRVDGRGLGGGGSHGVGWSAASPDQQASSLSNPRTWRLYGSVHTPCSLVG